MTATTTLKGVGAIRGLWVSSASATPTIKVEDARGGVIAQTFTPVGPAWYDMPFKTVGDVTVTIGGTVDCTLAYN